MKKNNDPYFLSYPQKLNFLKAIRMVVAGLMAIIYLLNPDAGIIELIPDNIPGIGNLDEVAATILLFKVFGHFGWNPFNSFGKGKGRKIRRQ